MILAKIPPSLRRVIAKKRRSTLRFLRYREVPISEFGSLWIPDWSKRTTVGST